MLDRFRDTVLYVLHVVHSHQCIYVYVESAVLLFHVPFRYTLKASLPLRLWTSRQTAIERYRMAAADFKNAKEVILGFGGTHDIVSFCFHILGFYGISQNVRCCCCCCCCCWGLLLGAAAAD